MSPYEDYYGYPFLDELHNFFPDFLYNNQRFTSLGDVFGYMNTQMSNRFNLYAAARVRHRRPARRAARAAAAAPSVPYFEDMNYIDNHINNNNINNINNTPLYTPSNIYGTAQAAAPAPTQRIAPGVSVVPPQRRAAQPMVDLFSTEFVIRDPIGGLGNGGTAGLTGLASLLVPELQPRNLSDLLGNGGIAGLAGLASLLVPELQPRNLSDLFAQIPGFADAVPVRPTTAQISAATTEATHAAEDGEVCAICQDDIISGCQTRKISHCDHTFHRGCIDTWFAQNVHCPVCRHDIRDVAPSTQRGVAQQVEGNETEDEEVDDNIVD
jgi:hypothetical protein